MSIERDPGPKRKKELEARDSKEVLSLNHARGNTRVKLLDLFADVA